MERHRTVTMDPNEARGRMNVLLYAIDGAPDLSDATAARLVDNMIEGRPFASTPVEDFAAALAQTVRAGGLDPQTAEMSRRFAERDLFDFVTRVSAQLEARRPWPPKKFTKVDVSQWPSFGGAAAIAQVNRPTHRINGATGLSFDQVPAGDAKLPVLIVQLRTGETVALMGSVDPRSTLFTLLYDGPENPATVIAHFRDLTGFGPEYVTPV
jgi:hypothetical protein